MSMIELMVALSVFAVAATGIAAGFTTAVKTSGNDRTRVTAANLAQREVEIVRNMFTATESGPLDVIAAGSAVNPNPLPGGVAGQDLVVDGRPYRVERSVSWLVAGQGESSCDGGSAVDFPKLALDVTVTWPGIADIDPVQTNTILTPPRSILNSNLSFLAVKVIDAAGADNPGIKVRVRKGTSGTVQGATTQADGCAVFGINDTGQHTVWLDNEDHVDPNGVQMPQKSVNISASAFQRIDFSYDEAATVSIRLAPPTGYDMPDAIETATLFSTGLPLERLRVAASESATKVENLWPITSGYQYWSGSCEQSDPVPAGGERPPPIILDGGEESTVLDAVLSPVSVRSVTGSGTPVANVRIMAEPYSSIGCSAGETEFEVGRTDSSGVLNAALPAGRWALWASGTFYPVVQTPSLVPGGAEAVVNVRSAP